jgi:hypothetical protein
MTDSTNLITELLTNEVHRLRDALSQYNHSIVYEAPSVNDMDDPHSKDKLRIVPPFELMSYDDINNCDNLGTLKDYLLRFNRFSITHLNTIEVKIAKMEVRK